MLRPSRLIQRIAAAAIVLPWLGACGGGLDGPPERIVLIVVDTLRRDFLSTYGSENATPNLDALAERGQLYKNHMASFHQTSMSMASLFTGRTPSLEFGRADRTLAWNSSTWCGLHRFARPGDPAFCIPPSVPTLAEKLREAGYATLGIASNQFLYEPSGFSRGFDDWVEVGKKPTKPGAPDRLKPADAAKTRYFALVNQAALQAVDRRASDRFYLYVHYMDVHDYGDRRPGRYAKAVRSVDRAIGVLLGELVERGLLDDAVVIATSDHGERLSERHALRGASGHLGNPSFQEVLDLPLIVAPPIDRDPEVFLRTEDLFHVILELAGTAEPAETLLAADELFVSERGYRTYLRDRYKSVQRRADGAFYLFDLAADEGETRDVAGANAEVAAEHRRRIREISDALGTGRAAPLQQSEDDRRRLRALGYLEQVEKPEPGD
jgi:arylsulfatase A-like enzyme